MGQRKIHYDQHSRTNPMENCNVPSCKRAVKQEIKELAEDEARRASEFEDGIVNGEPWALPDNPELWNLKYKEGQ